MKPTNILTLLIWSRAVTALDVYFDCPYSDIGACCLRFDTTLELGYLCMSLPFTSHVLSPSTTIKIYLFETGHEATRERLPVDPGSLSEWACLNNVDFRPACCSELSVNDVLAFRMAGGALTG
jgi:hypothetical protein